MKKIALFLFSISVLIACKKEVEIAPCDNSQTTNIPAVTTIDILPKDANTLQISYSIDYIGHVDGDGITESGIYYSNKNNTPDEDDKVIVNSLLNEKGVFQLDIEKEALEIGRWYFRAYAINCAGKAFGKVISYSLEVDLCDGSIIENLPEVVTQSVNLSGDIMEIKYAITRVGGDENGISSWGVCWTSEDRLPIIDDERANEIPTKVVKSSNINKRIDDFVKGTNYKFRSFAVNCAGTTYGQVIDFTTPRDLCDGNDLENRALISTDDINKVVDKLQIAYTINRVGGDASGISSKGICWSFSNKNPDLSNDYVNDGTTMVMGSFVTDLALSNFTEETVYYLRSFATNCAGTNYGDVLQFDNIDYLSQIADNMISVVGESFTMGCTGEQNNDEGCGEGDCYTKECPEHAVSIGDFKLSKFELTQAQWRAIAGSDPDNLKFVGCDQCPVESVSWDNMLLFIKKLNTLSGKSYRLPTEAEWEYAARGGNKSKGYKFAGSNTFDDVGWNGLNARRKTHEVGGKLANELGFYDMSGNVYEFCQDDFHGDYINAPMDGSAWIDSPRSTNRVSRGGSWINYNKNCRVADRYNDRASLFSNTIGLRLAHD